VAPFGDDNDDNTYEEWNQSVLDVGLDGFR